MMTIPSIDIGGFSPAMAQDMDVASTPETVASNGVVSFLSAMSHPLAENAALQNALAACVVSIEKASHSVTEHVPASSVIPSPTPETVVPFPVVSPARSENLHVEDAAIAKPAAPVVVDSAFERLSVKVVPAAAVDGSAVPVVVEEPVVTVAANEPVVSVVAKEPVVAVAANEPVAPVVAKEPVVAVAVNEPVAPVVAKEPVVAVAANEPAVPVAAKESVVAVAANEPAAPVVAKEPVVAVAADEPAAPVVAKEPVVAVAADEPVAPVVVKEQVVTVAVDEFNAPVAVNVPDAPAIAKKPVATVVVNESVAPVVVKDVDSHAASPEVGESPRAIIADDADIAAPVNVAKTVVLSEDAATVDAEKLVAAGFAPVMPNQQAAVPLPATDVAEMEAIAARTVESVDRVQRVVSASEVLVETARVVADTILVTPGLLRGQGEVRIQLRPDVLDGTEVRIAATGRHLEVEFIPMVQSAAVLIEQCRPQFEQHLAERIHAFAIAVKVSPNVATRRVGRARRNDEEVA